MPFRIARFIAVPALIFIVLLTATHRGQAAKLLPLQHGEALTIFPPMGEGLEKVREPWREDLKKIRRGLESQLRPDDYMAALESTGMAAHLAMPPVPSGRGVWELRGPVGRFSNEPRNGRIAGIQVITGSQGTEVFVGSCQGGLWVTNETDASGPLWQDIGRGLPNPSVRALAVHPTDRNTIFVGTGDVDRYWGAGMFVTHDGGANWDLVTTPQSAGHYFRILYQDKLTSPLHGYMIAASGWGLFRSIDGGATWFFAQHDDNSPTDTGLWTDILEHPSQPNILYACNRRGLESSDNGIYKSTDYGATWTQLTHATLPTGADWDRASIAICESAPDVLALLVEAEAKLTGIYRTTNGGATWTDISGPVVNTGGTAWSHAQAIAIRPTDPDQIITGAVELAMTIDGGANWTLGSATGINWGHADITQLYFSDDFGPDLMWICNDGGVYSHYFVSGLTADFLGGPDHGLACSEIDYMDADRGVRVIGLQDNGILRSMNAGQDWELETGGDGADVEIFDPEAGSYFFNFGVFDSPPAWRHVRKTGNSAAQGVPSPDPVYMPRLAYYPDSGEMLTNDQQSVYSLNAASGTNWSEVIGDLQVDPYTIRAIYGSRSGDSAFYVVYWDNPGDLTVVYKDGGAWQKNHIEDIAGTGQDIATVTTSREWPGEAWLGLKGSPGQAKILHITDHGLSVEDLSNELASLGAIKSFEVQPFNPDLLYAGSDLGMFRSTDGGQSWSPYMDGLPIGRCMEMRFVLDPGSAGQHSLELAMDGRGFWSRAIDAPPVVFVDKHNTGSADGTREHPWPTVAQGVSNAPAGAIVAIRTETYDEPQLITAGVRLVTWGGSSFIE